MRKRELSKLMAKLKHLTPLQRRQVTKVLQVKDNKLASLTLIEDKAAEKPCCPHCKSYTVVRNGTANGLQRFKCLTCVKTFNALTGTPLARLRMKEKWLCHTEALRDGLPLSKVSERLTIAHSTAFRWRHRFLALPKAIKAQRLSGIVEADETYFLESHKGSRRLSPAGRKRGGKAKKRGLSCEQVPVLISRDRSGSTMDCVLTATGSAHVAANLKPVISTDSVLCTDGSPTLKAAARDMGITHRPINLTAGIRVIAGVYHVQNVNAYGSRLKGWLQRFRGVATKYLDSYLGWFRAIERAINKVIDPAILLAQAAGKKIITT